jgi:spore coat polysaccharide biosynthesis predicted glycosyltransferase SpsG
VVIKKAKVPHTFAFGLLKFILDLFETVLADSLAVEEDDIVRIAAEDAGGGVLLKNDSFVINKDLNGILDADVKRTADLNGKNYSSELVDTAYYSGRFHFKIPPKFYILCFVTSL